jgi:hypothetical protein
MAFDQYTVEPDYITPCPCDRRPGHAITPGVRFIVAHDTSNPNATAKAHARWYCNAPNPTQLAPPNNKVSSAHIFVDDHHILETIPALTGPPEQARHVLNSVPNDNKMFGYNGNAAAIGVEYCYGSNIDADQAYPRYVWVLALLCHTFDLNPLRHLVGHSVLDPGRRHDPGSALALSGRSYDQLIIDVKDCFVENGGVIKPIEGVGPGAALRATVNLRVRRAPDRNAESVRTLRPGDTMRCVALVEGDPVFGITTWCQIGDGEYCWSGGVAPAS